MTNEVNWPEAVWQEINDAVLAEVSRSAAVSRSCS